VLAYFCDRQTKVKDAEGIALWTERSVVKTYERFFKPKGVIFEFERGLHIGGSGVLSHSQLLPREPFSMSKFRVLSIPIWLVMRSCWLQKIDHLVVEDGSVICDSEAIQKVVAKQSHFVVGHLLCCQSAS
jgi:hypothetical protein